MKRLSADKESVFIDWGAMNAHHPLSAIVFIFIQFSGKIGTSENVVNSLTLQRRNFLNVFAVQRNLSKPLNLTKVSK